MATPESISLSHMASCLEMARRQERPFLRRKTRTAGASPGPEPRPWGAAVTKHLKPSSLRKDGDLFLTTLHASKLEIRMLRDLMADEGLRKS